MSPPPSPRRSRPWVWNACEPLLDTSERWDRRLSDDEKQCLAFARVILQRPQWLVLNGALDVLDSVSRATGRGGPSPSELPDVGLINIGQEPRMRRDSSGADCGC